MKLSMWIFVDWLKGFNPKPHIVKGGLDIDTPRFYTKDTVKEPNVIYIGRMSDIVPKEDDSVACIHQDSWIKLPTNDIGAVSNQVLSAFEFYNKWEAAMLTATNSGAMVSDLLKISENILRWPVFVLDSNQSALAMSSLYGVGTVDEQWDELLQYGSCDFNFIKEFNVELAGELHKKRGIYHVNDEYMPSTFYSSNFFLKNTWLGVSNFIDIKGEITFGEQDTFELFCQHIQMWFETHAQDQAALLLDSLLHKALLGNTTEIDVLDRQLQLHLWNPQDAKMIILLRPSSDRYNIHNFLCKTINESFPSVYAVTHNESICMLCNLDMKEPSALFRELQPWLTKSNYHGSYSAVFTNITYIHEHYMQAMITLDYCCKETGILYNFENFALQYAFSVMKPHLHTDILHPAVRMLETYDLEHHTEFGITLHTYLKQERSQSLTAKALNLHRNTLTYRLNRLKELLDYDLDDPQVRMHLLISYEFLVRNDQNQ